MSTDLPVPGDDVLARCGCRGRLLRTSRRHGGHVHVLIAVPCQYGHPHRVACGVIEHWPADHIRTVPKPKPAPEPDAEPEPAPVGDDTPAQPTLFPITERTAA